MADNQNKLNPSTELLKQKVISMSEDTNSDAGVSEEVGEDYQPLKLFNQAVLMKLEKNVKITTDLLEAMASQFLEEKAQCEEEISGAITESGQDLQDIMRKLEHMILYENYSEELRHNKMYSAHLRPVDEVGQSILLCSSVMAYLCRLQPLHLRNITNRLMEDTSLWLSQLFRFPECAVSYHEDYRDGIIKICRLAMHSLYPTYSQRGYESFTSNPPVIFVSEAAKPGLVPFLSTQLALPDSCIEVVPISKAGACRSMIDVDAFRDQVAKAHAEDRVPTLLFAYAGTPVFGKNDKLEELQKICKSSKIWFHVEGHNLALLSSYKIPPALEAVKLCDSIMLTFNHWLGQASLPSVTLYNDVDSQLAQLSGLIPYSNRAKLRSLPIWLLLQELGQEQLVSKISHSTSLARLLHQHVVPLPSLNCLEGMDSGNPTVLFRYEGILPYRQELLEEMRSEMEDNSHQFVPYVDSLNIWLSETLKRENVDIAVSAVDIENLGVCIRFAPLEGAAYLTTEAEQITSFVSSLELHIAILDATVQQRKDFQAIVAAQDNLNLVRVSNWAGLGAVCYLPDKFVGQADISDKDKMLINKLNNQLVQHLKSTDTAFSLGQGEGDQICVRFGLITSETDLEELIGLVFTVGREMEDSTKYIESMAGIIKEGIKKANEDLETEAQNKLAQEGVLRQMPIVASVVNWFSPPAKEIGVKGRTLNLTSGEIESTAETYEHKMQIQKEAENVLSPSRRPMKANLKPRKTQDEPEGGVPNEVKDQADPSEEKLEETN